MLENSATTQNNTDKMKLLCETQVINRTSQLPMPAARSTRATIALGYSFAKQTPDGTAVKELEMRHFTPQLKNGTRYLVKGNVAKIHARFLNEGKVTISFQEPPHDLMLKCSATQLKAFMQTLQQGLQGKKSAHLMTDVKAATAIKPQNMPVKKMVVTKRSDYPLKGFPQTLEQLKMTTIGLQKVSWSICKLKNLTILDLTDNALFLIPAAMGDLNITIINLSGNKLGEATDWSWLAGKQLRASLEEVNFSRNNLRHFPPEILKLQKLRDLLLQKNQLTHIPFAIRALKKLRVFDLADNRLQSLPYSLETFTIWHMDLTSNQFQPAVPHEPPTTYTVEPLWVHAARQVVKHKLPYNEDNLPGELIDFIEMGPLCLCEKLVQPLYAYPRAIESTYFRKSSCVSLDRTSGIYLDIVLCGPKCARARRSAFGRS